LKLAASLTLRNTLPLLARVAVLTLTPAPLLAQVRPSLLSKVFLRMERHHSLAILDFLRLLAGLIISA